ncbi:hypothetical protein WICMUC_004943 [Wickerhamomyces mucosus]|uniref:Uncharacterized protein n=1 Tax=Wickerhamomyces mucosus TaxID=1378264 RepID=A0A9P8PCY8_9ASCO|nr:hypothetical protein WICMUC_004943 [Wickerhamomyces mucosus]
MSNQIDLEQQKIDSDHFDSQTAHQDHPDEHITKVQTAGVNSEYVLIGRTRVLKSELYEAFAGTLQPGLSAPPPYKFANPAPLGLSAFALTTFVLSMINAKTMGIKTPNIVVGLAFFYGGLVQLLAGMWELALGNVFGGTALSSYGGFWLSFAAIYIDWFGIASAYTDKTELANSVGFYLLGWAIFTFILVLCTLKSTVAFFSLFFFLDLTFLLLSIGEFSGHIGVTRAGGVFGVITAFVAWYNAFAGIATKENSYVQAYVLSLPGAQKIKKI